MSTTCRSPAEPIAFSVGSAARVSSTAGTAALSVNDPGRLINGAIGATDRLHTGTYSRAVTFTLSATSP